MAVYLIRYVGGELDGRTDRVELSHEEFFETLSRIKPDGLELDIKKAGYVPAKYDGQGFYYEWQEPAAI